jgi:PAS domain S-box-containing protein
MWLLSRHNYLLFHTVAECFSIVVGCAIFIIGWNTRRFLQNRFFLFLGMGLLFGAFVNVLHMAAYKGMGVFPGGDSDLPTQLWIGRRFLTSATFVLAPLFIGRRPGEIWLFLGYGAATALFLASVLAWGAFPACFVEGVGLTPFKLASEYAAIAGLGGSLALLHRRRGHFDEAVFGWVRAAIVASMASGLAFTLYRDVYGFFNVLGHMAEIGSFLFLYVAVIETGLTRPYDVLFRDLKQSAEALRSSERKFATAFQDSPAPMSLTTLDDGRYLEVNDAFLHMAGYPPDEVIGRTTVELGIWNNPETRRQIVAQLRSQGSVRGLEAEFRVRSGEVRLGLFSAERLDLDGSPVVLSVVEDITEGRRAHQALTRALEASEKRQAEVAALLQGAKTLLERRDFLAVAQSLFEECKGLTGATAGYIALLSRDESENEVVFLDSGGLDCTVDPDLPMPIRGLRAEAQRAGRSLFDNAFARSPWARYLPPGHSPLENVLFAPMIAEGKCLGILGLSNKPGGFEDNDLRLAEAFAELAAIGFLKSRALAAVERSEERFRSVVQTAGDAIITMDERGRITYWNRGAEQRFGFSAEEVLDQPLIRIMPERFRGRHEEGLRRYLAGGGSGVVGRTLELSGLRKDGSEFPMELSVTRWTIQGETHFTGIVRDITERKRAEEALRKAYDQLEQRVAERTADLMEANRRLTEEIAERRKIEGILRESQERLRRLSSELLDAQERERKRIAQELHDSIGQSLSAIKFSVENTVGEAERRGDMRADGQWMAVVSMLRGTIEEVRKITTELRPSILDDLGIRATIGWFCREYRRVYTGITLEEHLHAAEQDIPGPLKITIFRIVQEALNNVAKHSRADRVFLSLRKEAGELILAIEDNGVGMPGGGEGGPPDGRRGLGLAGMRERAELSGGSFSITSGPGQGTRVDVRWPAS